MREGIQLLKSSFERTVPKTINFEGIGYFEGKNNVAFFEPDAESSDFLKKLLIKTMEALNGKVNNVYDDYNFTPGKFVPHMTIAERIPENVFEAIKKELGSFNKKESFFVSSVFLYRQKENSSTWENVEEICF